MEIKTIAKGDIFKKIPSKVMNEMEDAVLAVLKVAQEIKKNNPTVHINRVITERLSLLALKPFKRYPPVKTSV